MSEFPPTKPSPPSHLFEKKTNLLLDFNDRTEKGKNCQPKTNTTPNHKNGNSTDKNSSQHPPDRDQATYSSNIIDHNLHNLRRQI